MNGVLIAATMLLGQSGYTARPTRWVYPSAPVQQRQMYHARRQIYYTQTACTSGTCKQVQYAPQQTQVQYAPQYTYQQTTYASPTVYQQTTQIQYYGSDPGGFMSWLNATRAQYGLGAVGYDSNLEAWASQNNAHQSRMGLGHFVMGPARRQNSAMSGANPGNMWMNSPGHRSALLDPTITRIGISFDGTYWTFNAS